jgi:hypothetical protein
VTSRIVRQEFQGGGCNEPDLPRLREWDKDKALARPLRQETTMISKWTPRRLHTGSWTYVSNLLHEKPDANFVSIVRTDAGTEILRS